MQSASSLDTHRGDLSRESVPPAVHPSGVTDKPLSPAIDDVASRRGRHMYQALSASSVGLELGISVLLGLLGGLYADDKLGTQPWLMLVGLGLGLIAGFRGVLRAVKRFDRLAQAEEARRA